LNFWHDPHHIFWAIDLITVLLMGMIHGITPDEHTWPITFSYSIGSYSTRGGMRAGLFFSLAFTLQRAIASELAYFALVRFFTQSGAEQVVYMIVGLVMLLSGYFIMFKKKTLHLFPWIEKLAPSLKKEGEPVPVKLALIHGFIAGWGTGAFATIIYTVISPNMPNAWVAFLPGLLYGIGTMIMQILIGGMFGRWIERQNLDSKAKSYIGEFVSANTLLFGGILFVILGMVELMFPKVSDWGVSTGLPIFNLDSINVALLLTIFIVGGVGGFSIFKAIRKVKNEDSTPI
jgi:MFS family permease